LFVKCFLVSPLHHRSLLPATFRGTLRSRLLHSLLLAPILSKPLISVSIFPPLTVFIAALVGVACVAALLLAVFVTAFLVSSSIPAAHCFLVG